MELTLLKDSFEKIISKGTEDLDTITAKDLKILNSSIILSIVFSSITAIAFLFLGLKVATYVYLSNLIPLTLVYMFNRATEPKIYGLAISIFSVLVVGFLLAYYGASYGFHFLFLTSLIISLFNVKTVYFRKIVFFSSIFVMLVITALYFYNVCPIAPPLASGDAVNIVIALICVVGLYNIGESYFTSLEEFEGKRKETIESLIQKNEEITSFNHTVAHDLKEPLRAISSFSRLLFRNVSEDKLEDSIVYNEFIKSGVTRMGQLLDDLMTFIETDDKSSVQIEVNLDNSLIIAEQNLVEKIRETNAIIHKADLPTVIGNQSYCILLFQNLLGNALKFTKPGVDPVIDISYEEKEDEVTILVKDNGIGIEEEFIDKIFTAFRRLNTREDYEGSGLGLSLCKKIVDFWKGSIDVESEFGKGSTFKINIPKTHIVEKQPNKVYKLNASSGTTRSNFVIGD